MAPRPRGIKRQLNLVLKNCDQDARLSVSGLTGRDRSIAGGLAAEGYLGGYMQAIHDVLLALNGVTPDTRDFWIERETPNNPE